MATETKARLTLVCLHFLGGSALSWLKVTERLDSRFECIAVDLPGFGAAAKVPGYSVENMADRVVRIISESVQGRWVLAGHSMGAKVAAVVARRAEAGDAALADLSGLVLLAGSPPCQEPMCESKRGTMLSWFGGDAGLSRRQAQFYIEQNSSNLDALSKERAVADVLRAAPSAWRHWLEHGSREDVPNQVGRLHTPGLLIAGEADDALGPDAQRRLMMPHFEKADLVCLANAKHLLPLEQPDQVARLIAEWVS